MTTERTPNIPLLRKAVEWVEEQAALPKAEREWHQNHYFAQGEHWCGTAMCVAGKVALDLGWKPVFRDRALGRGLQETFHVRKGPRAEHVSDVAANALRLTDEQEFDLFHGTNTAADIRRIAEKIAGEPL